MTIFTDAQTFFTSISGVLQIFAIGLAGIGGIIIGIQLIHDNFLGDFQGRQTHIKRLEWVVIGAVLVYAVGSIISSVTGFFGG